MPALRTTALALLALLLLAGCSEDATSCVVDADCGAGFRCTQAGSCERLPPDGGGGAGGVGPVLDACADSDDCLAAPFELVPDVYWDGSPTGEQVCTVPLRSCPGGGECPIPTECRPILEDATLPGLLRCELDSDCWSGRCLTREGIRFCLRACAENTDCPYNAEAGETPGGFGCERLVDRGVPVHACVPLDPATPGRTLCRDDCDCGLPGACAPEPGLACRFVGVTLPRLRAVPVCEPLPAGPGRESGERCGNDPVSCHGGACEVTCSSSGDSEVIFCAELRCTQPCDRDAVCPERLVCTSGAEVERVGSWHAVGADDPGDDGRDIHFCGLPRNGCEDEQDCCPLPDGAGGCLKGWGPVRRRCSVASSGAADAPRLVTICADVDPARAQPGACCAAHADCDSSLCVPARAGTPCEGGGVCSVPCESDPDAGTGADPSPAKDRCATADFGANLYHQGSSCLPFDYALPTVDAGGAPGSRLVTLRVCR